MTSTFTSLYPQLKLFHATTVGISGSLFLLRFIWMLQGILKERGRWVRTLPHLNDTLLLLSGIGLAWLSQQSPLHASWLGAKLCLLLIYILLGGIALKWGKHLAIRRKSGIVAIACYLYIVLLALSHRPYPTFTFERHEDDSEAIEISHRYTLIGNRDTYCEADKNAMLPGS